MFHFEEIKRIDDAEDDGFEGIIEDDPLMGLIPWEDYDPTTGEILDDMGTFDLGDD